MASRSIFARQTNTINTMTDFNYNIDLRHYLALCYKIAHYFSGENGDALACELDIKSKTLSRYENEHQCPLWDNATRFLLSHGFSLTELEKRCMGHHPSFEEIKLRIDPKQQAGPNPLILVAPYNDYNRQIWFMQKHRFLIPVSRYADPSRSQHHNLWKQAQYLLLYKDTKDYEVARMFRIATSPAPQGPITSSSLSSELFPCPGLHHPLYLDFHLIRNTYYNVWDWDWHQVYANQKITFGLPLISPLSSFF